MKNTIDTNKINENIDSTIEILKDDSSYIYNGVGAETINESQDSNSNWNFANTSFIDSWKLLGSNLVNNYDNIISELSSGIVFSTLIDLAGTTFSGAYNAVSLATSQALEVVSSAGAIDGVMNLISTTESTVNNLYEASMNISDSVNETLNSLFDTLGTDSVFVSILTKGLNIFTNSTFSSYKDGISETSFGYLMENSWSKTNDSFLNTFANGSSAYTVSINNSTPFDPGENQSNLYGTMMLGAPPIFNHIADPRNRSIISTFLRDAKFLSLTPGYPKYNGSNYLLKTNDDALHQTTTGESMLTYLLKNGIDKSFTEKDRRYYTFKTNYDDYYAYLETMLNTIWIKMGLGTEDNTHFNIFSFFDIVKNGKIDPNGYSKLLPKYQSSFGFYVNPEGATTESINSQSTSFGASNASEVNSQSDMFQQILYTTGMGTGGAARDAARKYSNTLAITNSMKEFVSDVASNTLESAKSLASSIKNGSAGGILSSTLSFAPSLLADVNGFLQKDQGVTMQTFATTNGMRVVYPELWSDSSFSRTANFNFEFISPYGDPLSIFKYVMAPFAALLCFAMPRQAADNGFVSPFFVRADIPGLFTMDLGLITDFTWTRGGNQNLWTKDGLPRAISGSFTIADLYPYLSMTKRFSFLSANPNYTVFLDNLSGFHAVYDDENSSGLNDYWKDMLNRVNGELASNGLWNKYSQTEREYHKTVANTPQTNRLKLNNATIGWLRGIR